MTASLVFPAFSPMNRSTWSMAPVRPTVKVCARLWAEETV